MGIILAIFLSITALLGEVARGAPITDPDFVGTILNPADLQKYVAPLPNAYLLQIAPDTTTYPGEDYYRVDMGQFNHDMQLKLNPAAVASYPAAVAATGKLPPTPSWGYSLIPPTATTPATYYFPGPTIVNTQGRPSRVTWTNSLPAKHVIGLDPTLVCGPPTTGGNVNGPLAPFTMNAPNCAPENRVVVHTHGAHVWDDSDGDPLAWFSNNFAVTGETWKPNTQHGPVGTYRYINDQEAGTIWYHDHAMGLTHLNVYAGLAGFFLITDANEANLRATGVLPQYTATGPYEIPIALQDRKFYPDGRLAAPDNPVLDPTATIGPNIPCDATVGAYAPYACLPIVPPATAPANAILPATTLCDPAAVNVALYGCPAAKFSKAADGSLIPYNPTIAPPGQPGPFTAPSITPEFFGNVSIVNGIAWPTNATEQRKYRLRLLNGTDSRTYFLKFETPTITVNPPVIPVWHIGTDQAFLDKPVDRTGQFIILMPGERIDLIVDFAAVPIGTRVLMTNYGPMATANGLPAGPGNPLLDIPYDGVKPLPGQPLNLTIPDVMAFDIIAKNPAIPDATITLNTALRPVAAFTTYPSLTPTAGAPGSTGVPARKLALIERQGSQGRFMLTLDGRDFMDPNSPVTEMPKLNDIEEWEIANLTPDAHPIHLHQVAFQVVNRQEISVDPLSPTTIYNNAAGLPPFTRWPLMPYTPMPTYIYAVADPLAAPDYPPLLPITPSVATPPDPWEIGWKDTFQSLPGTVTRIRAKFDLPGLYVWHCHILSHEENDMMRPLIVTTPAASVTATLSRNGVALGTGEPLGTAGPITITAQGKTGLTGPAILSPQDTNGFEYQFSVNGVVVQPFTAWMYPMLDSFTWTPPANAPGTYTFRVDARQASAGTAGASQANFTTTYTLLGPAVAAATTTTPAGIYKAGSSISVQLAFNQPISSTAGLAITLNNGVVINTGALANVSSFSGSFVVAATGQNTPAGLPLDVSSITGSISDAKGNAATALSIPTGTNISNSSRIVIDTTLPTITVTAPTTAFVNNVSQTITGTATDPVNIQGLTVNGVAVTPGAAGAFSQPVTLTADAINTNVIVATDMAGNQNTKTLVIQHDSTLPTLNIVAPSAQFVNNTNQTVTCSASDLVGIQGVTVNGVAATLGTNGNYSAPVVLAANATTTLTVVATDRAGNQTTAALPITHSAILPTVTITSPAAEYVNTVNQTVAGTVSAVTGIQGVTVNGAAVTLGTGGTFSVPMTLTANAANTIIIVVTDLAGNVTTATRSVIHDNIMPTVTATPLPGLFNGSLTVTLQASKPGVTIYYTIDGTTPTKTASIIYTGPITLASTTTKTIQLKYFVADLAGNTSAVTTGAYTLHTTDLSAKVAINSGASFTRSANVTLSMSASDKLKVVSYAISTDNGATYLPKVNITPTTSYSAKVPVTLPSGDGPKSVYVVFTDGVGVVYQPVIAQITLDTVKPVSTVAPYPGNYPGGTIKMAFTTSEKATVYYTTDGTTPTTASNKYGDPFDLNATNQTVTIKYFAVDKAGNQEAVKTATYVFGHLTDMTATVAINNQAKYTNSANVTLSFSAVDVASNGVATMAFSNDGINFTLPEAYASATAMPWTLSPGDGRKTVYFRFVDNAAVPNTYTFTDHIFLASGVTPASGDLDGNGKVELNDSLQSLLASSGLTTLTTAQQARADVGPLVDGKPKPDGQVDAGDALLIQKRALGLISF
jgi:spore coat protein A